MSAEVINEQCSAPVWVVHGVNWHLEVPLDEYNSSFPEESQAHEAASIALYVFKGNDRGLFIVLEDGETEPLLSSTMIVAKPNTDPTKGFVPLTHEILANCGYYEDSIKMEKKLAEDLKDIDLTQIENEQSRATISAKLAALKKALKPKKTE